jgi:hypothetical protein
MVKSRFPHAEKCALFAALLCAALFLALIQGCGGTQTAARPSGPPSAFATLLVMPVTDLGGARPAGDHARSPISGQMFQAGSVAKDAAAFLHAQLAERLGAAGYRILGAEQAEGVRAQLLGGEKTLSERELLVAAGKAMGADAVVAGYVYRFQDRVGNALSVDTAASVAFDFHLVDAKDGRLLYSGAVDETQAPLSDNLLEVGRFMKRGAKWVNAWDLAQSMLEEKIAGFPRPSAAGAKE